MCTNDTYMYRVCVSGVFVSLSSVYSFLELVITIVCAVTVLYYGIQIC